MKKYYILFILIIIIASFFGCHSEQGEFQKVTVVLDWVPNTNHTGFYVAKNLGYYKELGLDVDIVQPSEGGSADLIAAGQGEFGVSYQEQVSYAKTTKNPLPVKAIAAIIQHNTSGFASPTSKGIVTPLDFENKKYGGWGSPMEEATIKSLMDVYKGDFSKVEMIDIGALSFFEAVENHVDFTWIYYGWDGIDAELRNYPINFIKLQDVDKNLDFYTPIIITSEALIENDPILIKKFMEATAKGYEYAVENPEKAVEELLKDVPEIDRELAIASQKYLANKYIADAKQWGIMKSEIWDNYGNWMYQKGLLENPLDSKGAFTNEFLPKR
ncbi:MAG: ABC transporter substrate-binding protein [Clostridiales bacterium]|nr:ABC transporter substrate-binding protein [Clostridiales bacterium]